MLRNPIVHGVNVTYVVPGTFAQKPLVAHDFFALRRRFTVQAGLCRDRLHQSRRTQSLRRFRRAECPSRFHTLCNMPRNGFFSSPKTEREIAAGTFLTLAKPAKNHDVFFTKENLSCRITRKTEAKRCELPMIPEKYQPI